MKNKNFLTFEKALENAFDNNLNSFKFKGVIYDLEDIDDLANYKDLEVYQLGGNSKKLWNAQTGGETEYAQDGKNNINNSYSNKNKSILFNNNNLVGSKNKGLDREANQSYSKLQQNLLNQEKQRKNTEEELKDNQYRQTYLSEYKPLSPHLRKLFVKQNADKEFRENYFDPTVKALDVATDIGSAFAFLPFPGAQVIGGVSSMIGAGIDLYQTADALRKGDYESALINGTSLAVPYAIENPKILGSFKRTNKYLDNGNLATKYGRTTYLPVDKLYKKMKPKELYGNRGLLGAVGVEAYLDMKQTGGQSNNLTIVENGEYVKDNQGKIGKITNIPSHDDNELIIDGESLYVPEGQGGQGTYNVNSVLSATQENRNQSDNTYGRTDEEIKIKPQEALALAEQLNLSIKRPLSSMSPAKLMDKLLESREKLVSKYKNIDKPLNFERQANSFVANVDVLKSIPTPEDIYEFLFQNQEDSKSENNEMYAQTGIQLDPSKRGTFKAQATRMGMSVQEAARKILGAPEGRYTPEMRRKANFARNFAKQTGGKDLMHDLGHTLTDARKRYLDSVNVNAGENDTSLAKKFAPIVKDNLYNLDVIAGSPNVKIWDKNKITQTKDGRAFYDGSINVPYNASKYYNNAYLPELAHSYQEFSKDKNIYGVPNTAKYANQDEYDMFEYDRKGSSENQAHKYIDNDFIDITKGNDDLLEKYRNSTKQNITKRLFHPSVETVGNGYVDYLLQQKKGEAYQNNTDYKTKIDNDLKSYDVREALPIKKYGEILDRKQTGGKNVISNGKPMYQRKDGKIVERGLWSNTYLSKKQIGGQYIPVNTELPYNQYMESNIPMPGMDLADMRGVKTNREGQFENLSNREYKKISKSISEPASKDLFKYQVGGNKIVAIKNPLRKYVG